MFRNNEEKRELYKGKYKPLITDWRIVYLVKDGEPVDIEDELTQMVRSLPFSDAPRIEFSECYRCRIEGRVFGHNTYPYANGINIITSKICSIEKMEDTTEIVIIITETGSKYYLSLK